MKLKYGFGVNDADYAVMPRVAGKHVYCPYYQKWHHMLMRCYCEKFHAKRPNYIGCNACEEWRSFMAFRAWMMTQDWQRKELDKDLCGDGKLYSPDNCVFISQALNSFMTDRAAERGLFPIGVRKIGNRFQSRVNVNGNMKFLGAFGTPEEAHAAWVIAKTNLANDFIAIESDARVIQGIRKYIDSIRRDLACTNVLLHDLASV
jgi:hypothetical protein